MATELLLPGMGGRATQTVAVTENEAASYSEPLDLSRCAQFAVQVTQFNSEAELTLQVQQSFDNTNWANLGIAIVVVEGDVFRFDVTDGPFGLIRYELTSEVSDASSSSSHDADNVVLTTTGYPMQGSN
jgi:hypothetical protein